MYIAKETKIKKGALSGLKPGVTFEGESRTDSIRSLNLRRRDKSYLVEEIAKAVRIVLGGLNKGGTLIAIARKIGD